MAGQSKLVAEAIRRQRARTAAMSGRVGQRAKLRRLFNTAFAIVMRALGIRREIKVRPTGIVPPTRLSDLFTMSPEDFHDACGDR